MHLSELIEESTQVFYFGGFTEKPSREQTTKYMSGWCPYFALATHDILGYEIITAGQGNIIHFAVRKGDTYVDIRGIMTEKQFLNSVDDVSVTPMSREELIEEIESGWYKCGYFAEGELTKAKKLVKKLVLMTESTDTGLLHLSELSHSKIVAYHGTKTVFTSFEFRKTNHHPSTIGVWFCSDAEVAKGFAETKMKRDVLDFPRVVTADITMERPRVFDTYKDFLEAYREVSDGSKLRRKLIRDGFDGVIITNSSTDNLGERTDYVVFNNNQIKIVNNTMITESTDNGLLRLYHGGKDVESDYSEVKAHGKGRWEYGPGLYLTNDRHTAQRYAKGGRKLYVVDIDLTGAREMEDVEIPLHDAVEFVERNCLAKMRQKIIRDLTDIHERRGAVMAINVVYLCLNWEAIPNSKTDRLRQFLIDHGVDYSKVDRYGGSSAVQVYVVINPRIVKKVTQASALKERVENGTHLVYHSTEWGAEIMADNAIKAKTTMMIRGKKQRGISVTRSKRFAMQFAPLVLGLDRNKMAQRYRMIPHADQTIGKLDDHGDARREAEDFILCNTQIELTPYLYGFWINDERRSDPEYSGLTNHPLFKGWFPVV